VNFGYKVNFGSNTDLCLCTGSNHDVVRISIEKAEGRQEAVKRLLGGYRPLSVNDGLCYRQTAEELSLNGEQLQV
jgi:hypothetical protein